MAVNPYRLNRAEEAVKAAERKVVQLDALRDLGELRLVWGEFLTQISRAYDHIWKGAGNGSTQQWSNSLVKEAKKDPLLQYVLQARNADEHGLQPITTRSRGGVGFGAKPGHVLFMKRIEFRPDGVFADPDTARNAQITVKVAEMILLPVVNLGVMYPVPTKHLDQPFMPPSVQRVAQAALSYFVARLAEARALAIE